MVCTCPFSSSVLACTYICIAFPISIFMLDVALLEGVRDENAFLFAPRTCFAIIAPLSLSTDVLANAISIFVNSINLYSPLRVKLASQVYKCFAVIEMQYSSAVEQSYFSHLMWIFSRDTSAWIHIWDTHEHDALRRDFSAPAYMDSLLCINRLWIHHQLVHMITRNFSEDNPHGELIEELSLLEALACLQAHEYSTPGQLNSMAKELEKPMITETVDVCGVFVPRSLVSHLTDHPWLISPVIADPTLLKTSTLSSLVDLNDEVPFTVCVPQFLIDQAVKSSLTIAQSVSVGIKANIESHIRENKIAPEKNISKEPFLLEYLQYKLIELGLLRYPEKVTQINEPGDRFVTNWKEPFSIFTPQEEREWTKAEELKAQQLEALLKLDLNEELPDETHLSMPLGEDSTTVEKLQGLLRNFKSAMGESETPVDSGMYDSLNDEDVEKLTELEDFEDFIEFFAQNYMGFGTEDLAAHHRKKKRHAEEDVELELELEVDWEAYNNDSDYQSDEEL